MVNLRGKTLLGISNFCLEGNLSVFFYVAYLASGSEHWHNKTEANVDALVFVSATNSHYNLFLNVERYIPENGHLFRPFNNLLCLL